jgi:hypothetical protein
MRLRMQSKNLLVLGLAALLLAGGCHRAKSPPPVTQSDIEAAKQNAAHEVAVARIEATKDVRSATKVMGKNSVDVAEARVTAVYDIAMTKAQGDHTVATKECLAMEAPAQKACTDRADAAYDSAKAAAKAARGAHEP